MTPTFSLAELRAQEEGGGSFPYVTGVVTMDLDDIVNFDLEWFLDEISEKLVGSIMLLDVSYRAIGVLEDGSLQVEVTGDVSDVLDGFEE